MRKLLLTTALGAAAVGVGFIAVQLLDTGSSDRSGHEESDVEAPDRRPPAADGGAETGPAPPAQDEAAWVLTGVVREVDGRAVPSALLVAGGQRVNADAQGRFELRSREPELRVEAVMAMGYLPLLPAAPFRFEGRGPWRREYRLTPAASLLGRVTGPAGTPVPGATVYVISATHQLLDRPDPGNVAVTDKEGRYRFPGVPAGVTDVGVRAAGALPFVVEDVVIPERGALTRDLVVERGRTIKVIAEPEPRLEDGVFVVAADSRLQGRLLPPGGLLALADALVGRSLAPFPVVRVAGKGEYDVTGVGPGPADVFAEVKPYRGMPRFMVEEGFGLVRKTTEPEVTLSLLRAVHVELRVRDAATGDPLEPAVVRVSRGSEFEHPVARWQVFWQLPLDDRRHSLVFSLDGYQPARLDLPDLRPAFVESKPYPNPFDVAMQRVAEGEVGTFYVVIEPPLEGGRLALVGRSGEERWTKQLYGPDAEGRWVVEGVPVGEWEVSVLGTGMIPVRIDRVVVTRTVAETHRLRLEKGGGIDFKVTGPEGKLLDKVHVILKTAAGDPIDVHILTEVSEGRGFVSINYIPTAAEARADSGLAPGDYLFTAYREGYEPATESFTIRGTDVAPVAIVLRRKP